MNKFWIYCLLLLLFLPLGAQEKIQEKMAVDWWVLPLFALDKDGGSVMDLQSGDLELRVNGRVIENFSIYKRAFSLDEEISKKDKKPKSERPPFLNRKKVIYMIFDTAFTNPDSYNRSRKIARDIVKQAGQDTLFAVICLDPGSGAELRGGPTNDKQEILGVIDKKIGFNPDARNYRLIESLARANAMGKGHNRLEEGNIQILIEELNSMVLRANIELLRSFKQLYYALSSVKDHKFVYLFSEGMSLHSMTKTRYARGQFKFLIRDTAQYLSRSGAVLFVINPTGVNTPFNDFGSGEHTLNQLATDSGGKYIEGDSANIGRRLESMYRAYYEIAFPDDESLKGNIRSVDIQSKRKGVAFHSLRSIEKTKRYGEMKDIEKEVVILNILNDNPLFQVPLKTKPLEIVKTETGEKSDRFTINLPREFKNQMLDVYKVWIKKGVKIDVPRVQKERLSASRNPLSFQVKKEKNTYCNLVLVSEALETALVPGLVDPHSMKAAMLDKFEADFKKEAGHMSETQVMNLEEIKAGAAEYCRKLSSAVFHYICKEKVSEVVETLRTTRDGGVQEYLGVHGIRLGMYDRAGTVKAEKTKVTNSYVNDYQIISNKGEAREQRKLLEGKTAPIEGQDAPLRLDAFVSRRIALLPLSLLSYLNQTRFDFRLVKYDRLDGIKHAVIECFPKNSQKAGSVYGKLWIDLEDHSLSRVSVNPVSIGGYERLLQQAKGLGTNLILTCRIDFSKKRNGIRFPTKVEIREKYRGGKAIKSITRQNTWERSHTTYRFEDYKFFDVDVSSDAQFKK